MPSDDRPPRPPSASAPPAGHGHGADFATRNSLYALGIPTEAPWVRLRSEALMAGSQTALITVDGAVCQSFPWAPDPEQRDAWNGHALEVLGVLHAGTPDPRFAPLVGEYGPWWLLTDADGAELYVRIWRYRVLLSGTPLSVVLTLGHGTGQRRRGSIEGLELEHKPADTRRAAAAEALLWRLEQAAGGRSWGWRKGRVWQRRDYLDWYQSYLAESALDPKPPTLADLGKAMDVSTDTAGRRLKDLKPPLPWPPWAHPDIWDPDD